MIPTQKELDEAEELLRDRLRAASIASDRCDSMFRIAVLEIARIIVKYKAKGRRISIFGGSRCALEIQKVISDLIEQLRLNVYDYCYPYEEDENRSRRSFVLSRVFDEEDHGFTFDERMEADRMMLMMALSGIDYGDLGGLTEQETFDELMYETERAHHRLSILTANSVAIGWVTAAIFDAKRNGGIGYWIINGPNPCKYCASIEGWHEMKDLNRYMIPAHPHCQCKIVFDSK